MTDWIARTKRGAGAAIVGALALAAASIGLASPAAAVGTLDQSVPGRNSSWGQITASSQTLSQTFTAGLSGLLSEVDIYLGKTGSPTSVTLAVTAVDGSGNPTGAALASEVMSGASISGSLSSITVAFSSPATVTAQTQYALVLSCSGCQYSMSPSMVRNFINWGEAVTSYAGGVADNSNFSPWGGGAIDLGFATYVSPIVSAAMAGDTPPDVLQNVGLPTNGTCADVDDSQLNWAGVSSGGWTPSWAQWMNDGSGGAICGRTLYYAPSGRWAVRS